MRATAVPSLFSFSNSAITSAAPLLFSAPVGSSANSRKVKALQKTVRKKDCNLKKETAAFLWFKAIRYCLNYSENLLTSWLSGFVVYSLSPACLYHFLSSEFSAGNSGRQTAACGKPLTADK